MKDKYKIKLSPKVAEDLDRLNSLPTGFKLIHNKVHTPKQKRAIREAFNKIEPEFRHMVNKEFSHIICYGKPEKL